MPIVKSEIWRNHDRGNGRLAIGEKHTCHEGKIHENRYSCDVGYDVDNHLIEFSLPMMNQRIINEAQEREDYEARMLAVQESV